MSTFELYLFLIIPEVRTILMVGTWITLAICAIAAVVCAVQVADTAGDEKVVWNSRFWRTVKIAIGGFGAVVLTTFLPTTKIMLALIGWHLGTSVEGIENLPANMVDYLNTMIEIEIEDLKSDAAEAVSDGIDEAVDKVAA